MIRLTLQGFRVVDGDDHINLKTVKGVCGGWMEMIILTLKGLRVFVVVGWR